MQIQRPEMFYGLQELVGRRLDHGLWQVRDERFPPLDTYKKVQVLLRRQDYEVVDLWTVLGNPAQFLSGLPDEERRTRDELQTWLFANCELFLSGASGAYWIGWALGRPTLVTDLYNLGTDSTCSMFLPIMLWDQVERRLLSISEIGANQCVKMIAQSSGRLEAVYNSAEEIAEAVLELRAITRGEAEVDQELQAKVVQLANKKLAPGKVAKQMPILGQRFLHRHPEILA